MSRPRWSSSAWEEVPRHEARRLLEDIRRLHHHLRQQTYKSTNSGGGNNGHAMSMWRKTSPLSWRNDFRGVCYSFHRMYSTHFLSNEASGIADSCPRVVHEWNFGCIVEKSAEQCIRLYPVRRLVTAASDHRSPEDRMFAQDLFY